MAQEASIKSPVCLAEGRRSLTRLLPGRSKKCYLIAPLPNGWPGGGIFRQYFARMVTVPNRLQADPGFLFLSEP